jgi:hypothetical protein
LAVHKTAEVPEAVRRPVAEWEVSNSVVSDSVIADRVIAGMMIAGMVVAGMVFADMAIVDMVVADIVDRARRCSHIVNNMPHPPLMYVRSFYKSYFSSRLRLLFLSICIIFPKKTSFNLFLLFCR